MTSLFLKTLLILSLISCDGNKAQKDAVNNTKDELVKTNVKSLPNETGYLFVDISGIYYHGKELTIALPSGTPICYFKGENVNIENTFYDIIDQEHLYKMYVQVESFSPEYDLFILKAQKLKNGNYEVEINDTKGIIDGKRYENILIFKTPEQYVLEAYPYLSGKENTTPLRKKPSEESEIIPNFEDYTYVSVEIKGDWLKIRDDKECYPDEYPSKEDIIGWVRWRKNGEIIIDIRHRC